MGSNMAEAKKEICHCGIDKQQGNEEGRNGICEGDDQSQSQLPNTTEADLSLILVFLSSISCPNEDCIDLEENKRSVQNKIAAKACVRKLQGKTRKITEAKFVRRPKQSFQTTTRDCRHARKM